MAIPTTFALARSPAPLVTFPAPASSNPARRFPAPGFPVGFTSRVMQPIVSGALSAWPMASGPGRHRIVPAFHTATPYFTSSNRTLGDSLSGPPLGDPGIGMEWRMVIFSSLTSTSFTRRWTNALALWDGQGGGGCAQPRQKTCQGLGDPEIGLPVLGLIDNGLQFAMQSLFLTAQLGHSGAQLVDCDQLFLIGVDQTVDALPDPD